MVLELIAALLVIAVYVPLARRIQSGEPPRGAWDNFFEALLTFVRDQVAKPSLEQQADRYVPFLWTIFLFILFNNLLGMVPFLGSATASIYVTGALALVVFFAIHGGAIVELGLAPEHGSHAGHHGGPHDGHHGAHSHGHDGPGPGHGGQGDAVTLEVVQRGAVRYAQSLWPPIDVPFPMGYFIKPLVCLIEVVGLLVRNAVLAVRLFANMFAGHMVLATLLLFIRMAAHVNVGLWSAVTLSSVLGIVALSLLELFIAFLQAYIFTFLTALFMGMAMHPQH
jgi:F-type H+-transporting ATPase subunit a